MTEFRRVLFRSFALVANWLADTTNGIANLYAKIIHADKVETKTLCLDDVCVTKDQLQEMLAGAGATAVPNSTTTTDIGSASGGVVTPASPVETSSTTDTETPDKVTGSSTPIVFGTSTPVIIDTATTPGALAATTTTP